MMLIHEARSKASIAHSWSVTRSELVEFSHSWTIEHFSFQEKNEVILSPLFGAKPHDATQWCLKLCPRGEIEDGREFISIYLVLSSSSTDSVPATYKISILDAGHTVIHTTQYEQPVRFLKGKGRGFKKFILRNYVLKNCNGCLPNDKFTVLCEIAALAEKSDLSSRNTAEQSVGRQQDRAEGTYGGKQCIPDVASQADAGTARRAPHALGEELPARGIDSRRFGSDSVSGEGKQSRIEFSGNSLGNVAHRTLHDDYLAAASAVDDYMCQEISGMEFFGSKATRTQGILDQLHARTAECSPHLSSRRDTTGMLPRRRNE